MEQEWRGYKWRNFRFLHYAADNGSGQPVSICGDCQERPGNRYKRRRDTYRQRSAIHHHATGEPGCGCRADGNFFCRRDRAQPP